MCMYVKEVLFSETSTPKRYSAEVVLDKDAIFKNMKAWLESYRNSSKDTYFSIGNLDFEPDLFNDMSYDPNSVSEEAIDEMVKEMQSDWDYVVGDKLFIEGGGSYVSFVRSEKEMIRGIDEEDLLEVSDSVLLDIGFYLDEIKPEAEELALQQVKLLEREQDLER